MADESKSVPLIVPHMTLRQAGRAMMAHHFRRMLDNEAGTIEGSDPEALHDMRVATRRLRAAFRVFRNGFGEEALAPCLEEVRWLAGLLGRVRDWDVFLAWLATVAQSAPEPLRPAVAAVIANCKARHNAERLALLAALGSLRYFRFKQAFADFLQNDASDRSPTITDGRDGPDPSDEPVINVATRAIRREWRRIVRKAKEADSNDIERLHAVRIACKRLRYTAEFFADLFPTRLQDLIAVCMAVQDALGEMHDAYVHEQVLQNMRPRDGVGPAMRMALQQMIRALHRKQRAAYETFLQHYPALVSGKFQRKTWKQLKSPLAKP